MTRFPQATDYQSIIQSPTVAFEDKELRLAKVKLDPMGMPVVSSGGFALTYFLQTPNGQKWVVRCFKANVADRQQRYEAISKFLNACKEPIFTTVEYIVQGILVNGLRYPIVKMPQIEGQTLHKFIEANLSNPQQLTTLAEKFYNVVQRLEKLGIAHGDLQHGNIMVNTSGQLVLIDYDGMYIPALKGYQSAESGHRSYQHPSRNAEFGPELDRFSAIVIYLALKATSANPALWQKYSNGDNLLFQSEDFRNPDTSPLLRELESISGLAQNVTDFRSSCKLPLIKIPHLVDFLTGSIPVGTRSAIPVILTRHSYPIIDATDLSTLHNHIGDTVQVVGQITTYRSDFTKIGLPYWFLNFGDFKQGCITLVIWAETLRLFKQQSKAPQDYQNKWVSVTGQLSAYTGKGFSPRPQIIIDLVTQIQILPKEEATELLKQRQNNIKLTKELPPGLTQSERKLITLYKDITPSVPAKNATLPSVQTSVPPKLSPILLFTPSTIDFGEVNRDEDKKLLLTFKNIGAGTLNAQVNHAKSWLYVVPYQVMCTSGVEKSVYVQLNTKLITDAELQPSSTPGIFQLRPTTLSITSNDGTQTVEIRAKIKEPKSTVGTSTPKPKAGPAVQHRSTLKAVGIIATILLVLGIVRGSLVDPFKSFNINTAFSSPTADEAKLAHNETLSQTVSTTVTAVEPVSVKYITSTTTVTTSSRKVPSIVSVPSSKPVTRSPVFNSQSIASKRQNSCYATSPIELLAPIDTTSDRAITFSWQWHGTLPTDCGFEVRVWRDGETAKGVHDAIQDNLNGEIRQNSPNTYSLHVAKMSVTPSVQGRSGEYFWTVVLVKIRPTYEETSLQANPQRFWLRLSSD